MAKDRNYFRENRIRVQKAIHNEEFVIPLSATDSTIEIEEKKNPEKKLRLLIIQNVPVSDEIRPKSWLIDLEKEKGIFSAPQEIKKAEKALAFFTFESLYVVFFEMKETLKPFGEGGLDWIKGKIEDSITRISILLTHYIFGYSYNNLKIKYIGIICYNRDDVSSQVSKDPELARNELYKILSNKQNSLNLEDKFGGMHKVEIKFIKNENSNSAEMMIDLDEIFKEDSEYINVQFVDITCPILKDLPSNDDC